MRLPPASRLRFRARGSIDSDAKPPPAADHPPSTTPLSSPDSTAIQTLAFGLFTAFLAAIAVFISYRQLRIMLRRRKHEHRDAQAEVEFMQLRDPAHLTSRHNPELLEAPLLLVRVYTLQQYICLPGFIFSLLCPSSFPSARLSSASSETVPHQLQVIGQSLTCFVAGSLSTPERRLAS
jgi:hypothetical protein